MTIRIDLRYTTEPQWCMTTPEAFAVASRAFYIVQCPDWEWHKHRWCCFRGPDI